MSRRGWIGIVACGVVGLAVVAGGLAWRQRGGTPQAVEAISVAGAEPGFDVEAIASGLARGEAGALSAFRELLVAPVEKGKPARLTDEDLVSVCTLLQATGEGFSRYGPLGRATAAGLAGVALDRLAAEPAPAGWVAALEPIHATLSAALVDPDVQVRTAAVGSTVKIWGWMPGRTALPLEEARLAAWKDAFHPAVARLLDDAEFQVRAGAVLNMAQVPLDAMAAPAAARIEDGSPDVRRQVLLGFAKRPSVLSEEDILPRLHDSDPSIVMLAKYILDQRGLTEPQIELGQQVYHPNPDIRRHVLDQLADRDDIDPVVWIVHLSRDIDPRVRAAAMNAMAERKEVPEVRQRLTEMAVGDPSSPIRVRARKLLPPEAAAVLPPLGADETVAIPPLPGSPALSPRAN